MGRAGVAPQARLMIGRAELRQGCQWPLQGVPELPSALTNDPLAALRAVPLTRSAWEAYNPFAGWSLHGTSIAVWNYGRTRPPMPKPRR